MWFQSIFKIFLSLVALVVFIILLFIANMIWAYYFEVSAVRERFNSAAWIKQENPYSESFDPGCVRGGMALDLIKTDLIINHNAEQVVALLGKPKASEKSDFSYALGQCSGFGWLNSILVVKFENDLVTQLSVERDAP